MPTTVTRTYTAYTFGELSEDAKDRVRSDHANACGFTWASDYLASLNALAEHLGGRLDDYNIDWWDGSYSSAMFRMPDYSDDLDGLAVLVDGLGDADPETGKGLGSCVLTGFCGDEDAIDGLRAAYVAGERDTEALMQAAFASWLIAAQADAEYELSDEALAEAGDANGYLYDNHGNLL